MQMQSIEFINHVKEILLFLKTVTIKFSYFEVALNNKFMGRIPILTNEDVNFNQASPFVDLYLKDNPHFGIIITANQQKDNAMFSDGSPIIDSSYIGKEIFGTTRKAIVRKSTGSIMVTSEFLNRGLVNRNNNPIVRRPEYSFPYYINLNGEYHKMDSIMQMHSTTLDMEVPLTKENLEKDPVTKNLYLNSQDLMATLYNKYPDQSDLIKSIFYPIDDIDAAIDAENLTLLNYNDSLLHENEKDSIIFCIKKFLSYIYNRWYVHTYEYENLYPLAFWSMIWNVLPIVIMSHRIMNLKTNKAHPYHIWEYLESKGLKGYKGFLTNEQSLFLYRNIEYIKRNRGKSFILDILEDVFIKPLNHKLSPKMIYHSTEGTLVSANWKPEVLEHTKGYDNYNETSELSAFQQTIVENGFDNKLDQKYIQSIEDKFTNNKHNILRTKFLEISRNSSDNFYEQFFLRHLLDTIIHLYSKNKINVPINIVDDITGRSLMNLSTYQMIVLINWCFLKAHNEDISNFQIPTVYNCTSAIRFTERPINYPLIFHVNEDVYETQNIMDINAFYDEIKYPVGFMDEVEEFQDLIENQYIFLVNKYNELKYTDDMVRYNCLRKQLYYTVPKFEVTYNSPYATFDEFFNANDHIRSFIDSTISFNPSNDELYMLIYRLLDGICPLTSQLLMLMGTVGDSDLFWEKIKDLFVSLSSYNVAYIFQNKKIFPTFDFSDIKLYPNNRNQTKSMYFDGSIFGCNNMEWKLDSHNRKLIDLEITSDSDEFFKYAHANIKDIDIELSDSMSFVIEREKHFTLDQHMHLIKTE